MKNIKSIKENVKKIHIGSKKAFSKIKDELNEHLDSINQNTNEIQMLYGYLSEVENKIDKLNERVDEITFSNREFEIEQKFNLSVREEEVFLALYMSPNSKNSNQIAKILGLTDDLVNTNIYKLLGKGIPIQKELINEIAHFSMERSFKDLQARKNIVNVNEHVLEQFAQVNFS